MTMSGQSDLVRLNRNYPVERYERDMVIEPVPMQKDKSDRFLKTLSIAALILSVCWFCLGLVLWGGS